MTDEMINRLLNEAKEIASRNFCCPYSKYTVGATLLTEDNEIYKGFNIENDGIQSICAERVAFVKALSDGEYEFERKLILGAEVGTDDFKRCLPCGYCRQFMSEFVDKDFKIYTAYGDKIEEYTMDELLPYAFKIISFKILTIY